MRSGLEPVSVVAVAACLMTAPRAPAAASTPDGGKVVDVHDGDTITVEAGDALHKCRLLGIDAPELSYGRLWTEMDKVSKYAPPEAQRELREAAEAFRRWAGVMEGHARQARRALTEIAKGKQVRLTYDPEGPRRDRYDRLLVYVTVDGTDVNAEMIRRGLTVAYLPLRCDRLDEYVRLWRAAQAARVGLWEARDPGGGG